MTGRWAVLMRTHRIPRTGTTRFWMHPQAPRRKSRTIPASLTSARRSAAQRHGNARRQSVSASAERCFLRAKTRSALRFSSDCAEGLSSCSRPNAEYELDFSLKNAVYDFSEDTAFVRIGRAFKGMLVRIVPPKPHV